MKKPENKSPEENPLRNKAEKQLGKSNPAEIPSLSEAGMVTLIHELEVYKIELEMQNEELLREKELTQTSADKYSELFDFAPSGYFILSAEGEILEINLSGAGMLGKERLYLRNKRFGLFVTKQSLPVFNQFLENTFQFDANQSCDIELKPDSNSVIFVQLRACLTQMGGQCLVTAVDITEQKHYSKVLEDYNLRLEMAMQVANMSWRELNLKTGYIAFSKQKTDVLGYAPEKLKHIGDFIHLLHPDDVGKITNTLDQLAAGTIEKYDLEHRLKDASGEYRWFHDVGSVVNRDSKGNPLSVSGIALDITERKQAQ